MSTCSLVGGAEEGDDAGKTVCGNGKHVPVLCSGRGAAFVTAGKKPEKRSIPHTGGKMNAPESMMQPPCAKIPVPSCPDSGPSLGSGLFFRGFRRAVPGHEDVFHGFSGSCACATREKRCGARRSEKSHAQEAGPLRLCVPAYEKARFSTRKKRILCFYGCIFSAASFRKKRDGTDRCGKERGRERNLPAGEGGPEEEKRKPRKRTSGVMFHGSKGEI